MSNRRSGKKNKPLAGRSRRNRLVVLVTLALICIVSASLLAQVSARKKGKRDSGDVSAMSLSAAGPSKEYVYGGSKLIATVEPTASINGDDARFVSMCAYDTGNAPGSTIFCFPDMHGCSVFQDSAQYRVEITMMNTGSTTWTTTGAYCLRSQNPANNTTWGLNRVPLPLPSTVLPGQSATFAFSASRPVNPGAPYLNFQWQVAQDNGAGFFGEKTRNFVLNTTVHAECLQVSSDSATFVSQTLPSTMVAGQTYSVLVKMFNAGTTTWTAAGNYKLGSQFPDNNTTWGLSRVSLPASVAPITNGTFTFNVTAPSTPGTYYFQWMMVRDGGTGWFGNSSPLSAVNVTPPPPAAPSNMFVGVVWPGVTEITITWTDNSNNEDGFKVERQNGNSGWIQIATVGANVTTYTDTGLSLDTQYCYRVRAYNAAGGNSAYASLSGSPVITFCGAGCGCTSSGGD